MTRTASWPLSALSPTPVPRRRRLPHHDPWAHAWPPRPGGPDRRVPADHGPSGLPRPPAREATCQEMGRSWRPTQTAGVGTPGQGPGATGLGPERRPAGDMKRRPLLRKEG